MRRLVSQAAHAITVSAAALLKPQENIALVPLMRSGLAIVDAVQEIKL